MCGYQLCWNLGHASLFNSIKKKKGILLASQQIHIWFFIDEKYTFRMKTFFLNGEIERNSTVQDMECFICMYFSSPLTSGNRLLSYLVRSTLALKSIPSKL